MPFFNNVWGVSVEGSLNVGAMIDKQLNAIAAICNQSNLCWELRFKVSQYKMFCLILNLNRLLLWPVLWLVDVLLSANASNLVYSKILLFRKKLNRDCQAKLDVSLWTSKTKITTNCAIVVRISLPFLRTSFVYFTKNLYKFERNITSDWLNRMV